jgi:hypothetical protein
MQVLLAGNGIDAGVLIGSAVCASIAVAAGVLAGMEAARWAGGHVALGRQRAQGYMLRGDKYFGLFSRPASMVSTVN